MFRFASCRKWITIASFAVTLGAASAAIAIPNCWGDQSVGAAAGVISDDTQETDCTGKFTFGFKGVEAGVEVTWKCKTGDKTTRMNDRMVCATNAAKTGKRCDPTGDSNIIRTLTYGGCKIPTVTSDSGCKEPTSSNAPTPMAKLNDC